MSFLDVIPFTLFRVLGATTHARYVAVLEKVFEQFFDDFASAPNKNEVLQVIQQVLESDETRSLPDDGDNLPSAETTENAIYNRLREDGWIMEITNRRKIDVYMPRDAHALLSALITLKEELRVDISAEASLIDSGLIAAYQDPAGKVMNIAGARRQAIQLRRSIDGVLTSLHRIEEDLMRSENLNELLVKFMEKFVEKLLLENYRALKASTYNPMRFQRSILTNAERFISDDGQIACAATALADQKLAPTVAEAERQILQDLTRIRDVFATLGEKLNHIDRFSHKLERRIATTVRYQETARNVREERLRDAIRSVFARWQEGANECPTSLIDIPVPYSTATLALPRKARDPVQPQTRRPKVIDPADILREQMMDEFSARMDVTPPAIAERLRDLTTENSFFELDKFEPKDARDIAILYELRAGRIDDSPEFEIRRNASIHTSRYISGPGVQIRRKGHAK